jgi:hypothetical protein
MPDVFGQVCRNEKTHQLFATNIQHTLLERNRPIVIDLERKKEKKEEKKEEKRFQQSHHRRIIPGQILRGHRIPKLSIRSFFITRCGNEEKRSAFFEVEQLHNFVKNIPRQKLQHCCGP